MIGRRGMFRNENIDRAAFPTCILVEGPPGLSKAHFLDVLVGALNEGLDILLCAHGAGNDGFICARQRFIGTENRCGKQEGREDQKIRQSMFYHGGETNKIKGQGERGNRHRHTRALQIP